MAQLKFVRRIVNARLLMVWAAVGPLHLAAAALAETHVASRIDAAPDSHPLIDALRAGREALGSLEDVTDYEAIFVKKEILGGRLVEQQMQIRFREQPKSVLLTFIEPHKGREVLYIEGRNNNKLQVKDSGLIALVGPISLDPTSSIAMQETVYPITEIGIRNMLHRLLDHWLSESAVDDITVQFYPNARMGKQPCQVVEATHTQRRPEHQYHKVRLYLDKETGLPVRVQQLGFPARPGAEPPVIADYTYLSLKTNLGLTDRDFTLSR